MGHNNFRLVIPVLPSQDITRDLDWYENKLGFSPYFNQDNMYAGVKREDIYLHLQWHADTDDDPLLGGSVVRFFLNDVEKLFKEFIEKESITPDKLRKNTPWNTHEFGLYDLNNNALFFAQDL